MKKKKNLNVLEDEEQLTESESCEEEILDWHDDWDDDWDHDWDSDWYSDSDWYNQDDCPCNTCDRRCDMWEARFCCERCRWLGCEDCEHCDPMDI